MGKIYDIHSRMKERGGRGKREEGGERERREGKGKEIEREEST